MTHSKDSTDTENSEKGSKKGSSGSHGLGDVLHFFIPEDEQAEARARSATRTRVAVAPVWALVAHPERPLHAALAFELGRGLADGPSRILASFAPHDLAPRSAGVLWEVAESIENYGELLSGAPPARLVVLRSDQVARLDRAIQNLAGWLLPLDASAHGVAWGRLLLARLPQRPIRILFIGSAADAERRFQELSADAEFGSRVELLGSIPSRSDRTLLSGQVADPSEGPLRGACVRLSEALDTPPS